MEKAKLADSLPPDMRQYPSLQQWLQVVGLTQESIQVTIHRYADFYNLLQVQYGILL